MSLYRIAPIPAQTAGLFGGSVGTPTFSTSGVPTSQAGDTLYQCAATGTPVNFSQLHAAGTRTVVDGFRWRCRTTSSQTTTVYNSPQATGAQIKLSTSNHLFAQVGSGTSGSNSISIVQDQWYWIDVIVTVAGGVTTLAWQLDGIDQSPAMLTVADADLTLTKIGVVDTGPTVTEEVMDWVSSYAADDYPLGPHAVRLYPITSVGTHHTPTDFTDSVHGVLSAADITSFQEVDETPMSSTDYVAQTTVDSGGYLEYQVADSAGYTPDAILVCASYQGSASGAYGFEVRVSDGTGVTTDVFSAVTKSGTATRYASAFVAAPPSSGFWTQPLFDGTRLRFGYAGSGAPKMNALAIVGAGAIVAPPLPNAVLPATDDGTIHQASHLHQKSDTTTAYNETLPDITAAQTLAAHIDVMYSSANILNGFGDAIRAASPDIFLGLYWKGNATFVADNLPLPEDWFSHTATPWSSANRMTSYSGTRWPMNPLSTSSYNGSDGWSAYHANEIRQNLNAVGGGGQVTGWNLAYLDNMQRGEFDTANTSPLGPPLKTDGTPYTWTEWKAGMMAQIATVRAAVPANRIVWCNGLLDGAHFNANFTVSDIASSNADLYEAQFWLRASGDAVIAYATDAEWLASVQMMVDLQNGGCGVTCTMQIDRDMENAATSGQLDQVRDYHTASYLISNRGEQWISYRVGLPWQECARQNYQVALGAPLDSPATVSHVPSSGAPVTSTSTNVYARRYTNGLALVCTDAGGPVTVNLGRSYHHAGAAVSQVTMAPNTGMILTAAIERPGHHTGFHKWLAGWCSRAGLQRAYLDGDYTIAPTETQQSTLPYVVTFNVGTRHYYIEYRQPVGFDAHISALTGQAANTQGVLINMVDYAGVAAGSLDYAGKPSGRGPWLLDMTPNSAPQSGDADAKDSALLPGDTYTDGAVTVTCSSVSGSSTVVTISGLPQPPIASTEVTGGGGLRTTAGRVMPGGLVIPAYPKILAGADDSWGFTTTGGSHVGIETATMLNRRMAIRRIHYPWGNGPNPNFSWPTNAESGDTTLRDPRVVPCITHGSQGQSATSGFPVKTAGSGNNAYSNTTPYTTGGKTYHGIDIITAGKFDAAYTNSFTRMAAIPGPVFFNLWMEMNIPAMGAYGGYQGGTNGPGQASYIAAYRHLHDLSIAAGATNVIWVWAPAQYDPQNNKLTYYPGDDVVDWVMLDLYSHYFNGNVDDIYNFAVAHNKPFGIAEGGFNDTNNTPNVSKAAMVTELQSSISLPKYAETSMYWTWNGVGPDGNHLIDTTSAALTAYQTLYASSNWDATYGGSAVDTTPPTAPTSVTATATGSAAIQIDWSGETDNIGVDHVEIWRSTSSGGTYTNVASDTATPYTDTGRTPATQYFYKLVAVDAANNKSGFSPTASATTQNVASFSVSTSPAVKTPGHYSSAFDAATNPDAGRMWQSFEINGVVYEFGESDHTVDHSTGVAIDRTSTPYVNAYDKVTGAVIQTWAPLPDGVVMDAQITSDGKIALVGGFQKICGVSMSGVAILNPLTDPTDTSAASLDSSMPDLQFAGGNVKRITIDVANSRGWVAGAFKTIAGSNVQPVARLKLVSGTWQVDSSFTPPSLSATGVYIQGLGAKSDGSSIVVGGQITGGVKKLNGTTGAAQTWNMNWINSGTQHCISITNDDTYVLCTGDNGEGGGCAILTDWTGAGPNTFTQFGGTGYWYTECDGNIQASALVTLDGVATSVMLGHHGNWCMPNKNQPLNAGTQIRSDGIYALLWGSGTSDPVAFLEPPAMGAASGQGSPLKNWGFYQDPTSGSLYANGDFTTVNGSALYTRAARFDAAGAADTTSPTAPSGMSATAVSSSEIDLAWTLGTDLNGIAHVQVYRDGAIVTTLIAASSYHDTGLTAQSTHTYHVTNSDPSGNVSTASGNATATTLVGPPPPDSAPLFQTDPTLSDTSPSVGELITVNDAQVQGSPTPALASQVQEAADTPAALIDFLCAYGFGGL